MKIQHLITAALTMLISSCSEKAEFDASGNFEATEVTLSAESSGKILSFDVEEGDTVEIGELLAKIDTVQLQLQMPIFRIFQFSCHHTERSSTSN